MIKHENLRSVAGWHALEKIRSAVANFQRARIAHEGQAAINAIFYAQTAHDAKAVVNGAWVTDLMDGREVALLPEIVLKIREEDWPRLEVWLASRNVKLDFSKLNDVDWQGVEMCRTADQLPDHLRELVTPIGEEIWRALDVGDDVPPDLIKPMVSSIEIRRITKVKQAGASERSPHDDLRLAADAYERAEAALSVHGDDPALRRELKTARATVISAINSLSIDFPFRILCIVDIACILLIYGLGDGREVGLRPAISRKPDKRYRCEAKKWCNDRGISQTHLGWAVLRALLAEDRTVPGHLFGMIKYNVEVWRKP